MKSRLEELYKELYEILEKGYGDCWKEKKEDKSIFCSSCIVKKLLDELKEAIDLD